MINNQVDSRKFEVFKLSNPKLFNEAIFSENIQTEQIKEGSWAMIGKHKGYDLLIIGEEYISIDADGGSSDEVRTVIKMLFENNLKHKMHVSKREPVIIEFLKTPLKSFKRLLPNQNPFSAMSEIKKPDLHTAVSGDPKFYKKVEISGEEIRKISLLLQDVDLQNKILTLLEFFPSTIIDDSGIISHIGDLLSERGEYKLAKGLEILTDVAEAFKKNADRCNTMQF